MLKIEKFTGLNNVDTPEKLGAGDLQRATNVDIGNARELMRRQGYSVLSEVCHKNVWDADGFQLATRDGGDLVAIADGDDPEDAVVLYPSLGVDRVWYCNLPDGRTTFSNGLINGIASATAATKWGVPVPSSTVSRAGRCTRRRSRFRPTGPSCCRTCRCWPAIRSTST
jgi:hypothetical protein